MSMGTDTTDLIITNGVKLWLRNIPIGGNHFTKQLSREMKLTQAKAEHLKRNARQAEDPQSVFRAMRSVFSDLVNEVQRSLTFFNSMDKSANISKVVLLGNAAKLPGLKQFLGKQLEIEISKIKKFEKLTGADVVRQKSFVENQLSFAPSYGLCLQGIRKSQVKTNLLPNEIVTERIIRAKKPWVLASVSFIMLGLLLGFFFKEKAYAAVRPDAAVNNVTWDDAKSKVERVSGDSSSKKKIDDEQKAKMGKLNRLSIELTSSFSRRSAWVEVLSAIYQALPQDKRLEGDNADPKAVKFNDREEIYLDGVESKFFEEIGEWYTTNKPTYESQFDHEEGSKDGDVDEAVKQQASKAEANTEGDVKGAGWVIEIQGYHYHNSNKQVSIGDADKNFLIKKFLKKFFEEASFPGPENPIVGGGDYKFEDFGIYAPTIVTNNEPVPEVLYLSDEEDSTDSEEVRRYDFVIQMAWIPRSPRERFEARTKRKEEEDKQKAAQEAAAAKEEQKQ